MNMGLYDTIEFNEELGNSFVNDGYGWDIKMRNNYLESKLISDSGQILPRDEMFCKNASIFDLTGTKIWWGDISSKDVKKLKGIYYILSEHKSFWDVPKNFIKDLKMNEDKFSNSPFRDMLPLEPTMIDTDYIKSNAIARINNGKIETNKEIISRHYS